MSASKVLNDLLNGERLQDSEGDIYFVKNDELIVVMGGASYLMRLNSARVIQKPITKKLYAISTEASYEATFAPERKDACILELVKHGIPYQLDVFDVVIDVDKLSNERNLQ